MCNQQGGLAPMAGGSTPRQLAHCSRTRGGSINRNRNRGHLKNRNRHDYIGVNLPQTLGGPKFSPLPFPLSLPPFPSLLPPSLLPTILSLIPFCPQYSLPSPSLPSPPLPTPAFPCLTGVRGYNPRKNF
jgi:hypothetical protein